MINRDVIVAWRIIAANALLCDEQVEIVAKYMVDIAEDLDILLSVTDYELCLGCGRIYKGDCNCEE